MKTNVFDKDKHLKERMTISNIITIRNMWDGYSVGFLVSSFQWDNIVKS